MEYLHVEVAATQSPRVPEAPCGDVVRWRRTPHQTLVILCDGLGHGVSANLAATMCVARLRALVESGFSLREAFWRVVRSMNAIRGKSSTYAVFTLVCVRRTGEATVLSYEMPPPIILGTPSASILHGRTISRDGSIVSEANVILQPGDGLLITSDGVTQAGLPQVGRSANPRGARLPNGWTSEGVAHFARERLAASVPPIRLAELVHDQARRLWGGAGGDDVTAVALSIRTGLVVQLLTGPPNDRSRDRLVVREFFERPGKKVVCGASTAKMVARERGLRLDVEQNESSQLAPPRYYLDGLDLVTEGAVTLNQVYNLLHAPPKHLESDTGVSQLLALLRAADRVDIVAGCAPNQGQDDLTFCQLGVLPRSRILPLLAETLEAAGKTVTLEWI